MIVKICAATLCAVILGMILKELGFSGARLLSICTFSALMVFSISRFGEIQTELLGMEKLKGKTRISMLSGYDAYYDYVKKFENTKGISNLLSVKPNESFEAVKKLYKELNDKNFELVGLKREILKLKYSDLKNDGNTIIFEEKLDTAELIYTANLLSENNFGYVCVLSEKKDGNGFNYVIKNKEVNMRDKIKEINTSLNGRGGGSAEMVQGFFDTDRENIEKVLTEL